MKQLCFSLDKASTEAVLRSVISQELLEFVQNISLFKTLSMGKSKYCGKDAIILVFFLIYCKRSMCM